MSSFSLSLSLSQPYQVRSRIEQYWPVRQLVKVVKCAKGKGDSVPVPELDRKLGDVIITEEELMGLGRLGDKCKETTRGIVELLECLEREAIMGEDEGKEPIDYNRRARLFDKSSRVFQALKESSTPIA